MNNQPKRTLSDEELDAVLGEPKEPTDLKDIERELENLKMEAWTANEHLASIRSSLTALAWIALFAFAAFVVQAQDWPLWERLKGFFG